MPCRKVIHGKLSRLWLLSLVPISSLYWRLNSNNTSTTKPKPSMEQQSLLPRRRTRKARRILLLFRSSQTHPSFVSKMDFSSTRMMPLWLSCNYIRLLLMPEGLLWLLFKRLSPISWRGNESVTKHLQSSSLRMFLTATKLLPIFPRFASR